MINPEKIPENLSASNHKSLSDIAQYVNHECTSQQNKIPPLAQWHPHHCGKMNLQVKANGQWWHEGQRIQRQALINLFARVLWKEEGKFYLKTPAEKIEIEVEDEPLFVNQVDRVIIDGKTYLQLGSTTGDQIIVDEQHPLFMREYAGEMRPYVAVRFGLNALIQRQAFYHLIEYGQLQQDAQGNTTLILQSGDWCLQLGS